ncbi:MAG: YcgN family cysteine cluster protein [Halioglobus sp.]|nr:YcgN family cysteine cluster protein [Halioglobus sp.]
MSDRWWEQPLQQLTAAQWEALCDGCGKCCLHKLQDAYSGKIFYTAVRCRLLDVQTGRCSDYVNRTRRVPDCVVLRPNNLEVLHWLPPSCAYRLRWQDRPLPDWHPLLSGDRACVHRAQSSLGGRTVSEAHVHPDSYEQYIVHWVDTDDSDA